MPLRLKRLSTSLVQLHLRTSPPTRRTLGLAGKHVTAPLLIAQHASHTVPPVVSAAVERRDSTALPSAAVKYQMACAAMVSAAVKILLYVAKMTTTRSNHNAATREKHAATVPTRSPE